MSPKKEVIELGVSIWETFETSPGFLSENSLDPQDSPPKSMIPENQSQVTEDNLEAIKECAFACYFNVWLFLANDQWQHDVAEQ